ncbi:hypothetical protein ACE6H2_013449 [Prunus campanulata]
MEGPQKLNSKVEPEALASRVSDFSSLHSNFHSPPNDGGVEAYREQKQDDNDGQIMAESREDDSELQGKKNWEQRKYFHYDAPLSEETGDWVPVSVLVGEPEQEQWANSFCSNGAYFPDSDMGWEQSIGEEKEPTILWDVVKEILLVARGKVKVRSFASADIYGYTLSGISDCLDEAWKATAQSVTAAYCANVRGILEAEPPKQFASRSASACMLCYELFPPIMGSNSKHHCRFCGGIFCGDCSKGRSLMPEKFHFADPQRVCDVCCGKLESVQPYLMDQVSNAAQVPNYDLTDLSTLRSWVNIPWGQSMEHEIYKAANIVLAYEKVCSLRTGKSSVEAMLGQAKGLAIITAVKVGVMVTYNIGTGLVVARRDDGSWSPPSAVSTFGIGWGAQAGGELIDFIIVLRTSEAVKTFSGNVHLSIGAGLSAAVGVNGRAVEADVRAGDGGYAACYTYSSSKGAFVGCSLEGSIVTTRTQVNSRFYGSQLITAADVLRGSLPRPRAAAALYCALADLYRKIER